DLDEALDALEPPELLGADPAARLARELGGLRPALAEARKLADLPRGRHHITYAPNVIDTLLDDQQRSRNVTQLLRYDAIRRAHGGDMKGALRSCRAALNAGRSIGDEPFSISQLIRIACAQVAGQTLQRVLAQGEPDPDELAALQKLFEDEDRRPTTRIMVRGERAVAHSTLTALEDGRVTQSWLAGGSAAPATWRDRLFGWHVRRRFREEPPRILGLLSRRAEAADRPLHEQIEADVALDA